MSDIKAQGSNGTRLAPAATRILREASRLLDAGNAEQAQQLLAGVIVLAPLHPDVLKLEAKIHLRQQDWGQALKALEVFHQHHAPDADSLLSKARAQAGMGHVAHAIDTLGCLCVLKPDVDSWMELAFMHDRHGDHQQSLDLTDQILAKQPGHAQGGLLRARTLQALGRIDEAAEQYRFLIASDTEIARAWFGLVDLKTVRLSDHELEQLKQSVRNQHSSEEATMLLDFALGNALEKAADYEKAFATLNRANERAAQREIWSASKHRELTAALGRTFEAMPSAATDSNLGSDVIFVCGLPRSGSTLIEQILAAHSKVEGASELPDLPAVLAEESGRRGMPLEKWAPLASNEDWMRLGQAYLQRTERWRQRKPISTDKNLENWKYIGAIRRMLPGSRIINCQRDAVETCWSCYKQLFAPGLVPYSYRLDDLASYWNDYLALSTLWSRRHPDFVRVQAYESILDDPEQATRSLLDFCGLPFEAECLSFQMADRPIRTASSAQVRQPLTAPLLRRKAYAGLLDSLAARVMQIS